MYRIYQTDLCHGSFRRSYILFIDEPVKWYVFPIHVGHVWHWTTIVSTIIPHCQQMGSGKKCHLVWMTMRIRLRHRWYVVILGHSIVQATMPLSTMQQFNRSELICLPSIRHTLIFTYPIYHIFTVYREIVDVFSPGEQDEHNFPYAMTLRMVYKVMCYRCFWHRLKFMHKVFNYTVSDMCVCKL